MNAGELAGALSALAATPDRIGSLTAGLPRGAEARKPSPDAFSLLENVWHLRDLEVEGYLVRIRRLLSETAPHMADFEGGRLARERRYNERDLGDGLDGFRAARIASVAALRSAGADALSSPGTLEGVGPITLGELVGKMLAHDREHIEEMERLRRPSVDRA
jgi:hypothetical protein